MKSFRTIVLLSLLRAGLAIAADHAGTNQMPASVHKLMERAGYVIIQTNLVIPAPDTNSLKYLPPIEKSRLRPLQRSVPKNGWSFWNNTGVKYVRRNRDLMNIFAPSQLTPYSALAQFEYDITYSFDF